MSDFAYNKIRPGVSPEEGDTLCWLPNGDLTVWVEGKFEDIAGTFVKRDPDHPDIVWYRPIQEGIN